MDTSLFFAPGSRLLRYELTPMVRTARTLSRPIIYLPLYYNTIYIQLNDFFSFFFRSLNMFLIIW
jgi:hypothetical protein